MVESQRPKRERAQTADRVVVKYLDRRARAPTVNRRPRSGVGGARRGVREYGAVNYHKVELKEQTEKKRNSSGEVNTRGDKQCCSCLERSDDPEQTSSGDTECVVRVDWSRSTWKSVRRRSDAVERTQLQLKPTVWANRARLDDDGENDKKPEDRSMEEDCRR